MADIWKNTVDADSVMLEDFVRMVTADNLAIRLKVLDTCMYMKLSGKVDTLTAPTFLQTWEEESAAHDIQSIEIDCSDLLFLSSAGLRALILIRDALPAGTVTLRNVNKVVYEVLEMTGLDDVLDVHKA